MIEKTTPSRIIFNIFNYSFMILFSIACIAPLWHVFAASVSDPRSLMASNGLLLKPVGEMTLEGYKLVLKNPNIATGYMNTIIYVIATTVLGTLLTLLAGYVISRTDLRLKMPITAFILFTMMFNGGLIPTYMVVKWLHLIGTRWALIIPGVINAFFIIIMKSAFEQLSPSYEESAKLDGAEPLTIMIRILVPLVKSTIAVVVMFTVVLQWNSWFPASIYVPTQRKLWPLQLVMREILVQNDSAKIISGSDAIDKADLVKNLVKYCTVIVGTLPVLCIYPFVQKYFVQGVTLGGVKG
jgi:putative aldouronate transport system permease protein